MASHVDTIRAAALDIPAERLLPAGGNDGDVVIRQAGGGAAWGPQTGGGASAFTDLSDVTFANYSGRAGQYLRVNAGATGLESVAASQSGTDASLSNYTPRGTGATTRTVKSKLDELVSVKDFGAAGNGSTDDRAAIQTAIDFAQGSFQSGGPAGARGMTVYFPHGVYLISSPLIANGQCSFKGAGGTGSSLLGAAGFPATLTDGAFTVPAPMLYVNQTAGGGQTSSIVDFMIHGNSNAPVGLHIVRGATSYVSNIRTEHHTSYGIIVDGVQNSIFVNCRPGHSGISTWYIINGAQHNAFLGCFSRFCGTASIIMANDATFPGSATVAAPQPQDNLFIKAIFEDETEGTWQGGGPTRTHCLLMHHGLRNTFIATNFVAPIQTALVEIKPGAALNRFIGCHFNTASGTSPNPFLIVGAFRTRVEHCQFQNFNGADLIQVASGQSMLELLNPQYANITASNKIVAVTGGLNASNTGAVRYEHQGHAGTTAQRPSVSNIDAYMSYYDSTLRKPIWWDPIAQSWKDATGTTA